MMCILIRDVPVHIQYKGGLPQKLHTIWKSYEDTDVYSALKLTFSSLWANSADDKVMNFFLKKFFFFFFFFFFFVLLLSFFFFFHAHCLDGDNLHEKSKPIFWENKKIFDNVVC